ncbi:MAG: hypothetical protein LAP38_19530 [Acidobacteriia bacterium]|nr:hypothetical protein [Terriglobia bacterium]
MNRLLLTVASIGVLAIGLTPAARADQWNKKTTMTVNETIQVPNKVLPPGTYVIKLLDSPSDRHIVQIFNADETELQTTILAIPNYRLRPTGDTVFSFWEMPPGQPRALRAWFYPGDNFGQEFAYPKTKAVAIAEVAHAEVPTTEAVKPAELATAPVAEINEEAKETPVVEAQPPAPVEVAQEITPAPQPELPKTASPYPLVGLAGLLSLAIFAVVRAVRTS